MMGPDFLVVGGHKCATTTLHQLLSKHPQISASDPKEPHYLARDSCRHRLHTGVWTAEDYANIWPADDSRLRGEFSVLYLPFADEVIRHIRAELTAPPKIIVLVRDPIDRALSAYRDERLKNPDETAPTFEHAIRREIERGPWRLDGQESPAMRYLALGLYTPGIELYQAAFGEPNVHVAVYDELLTAPRKFILGIEHFLGIDPLYDPALPVPHGNRGGISWRSPALSALLRSRLAVASRRALRVASPAAAARLERVTLSRLTKRAEPASAEIRRELKQLYLPEITRLRQLVGPRAPWLGSETS